MPLKSQAQSRFFRWAAAHPAEAEQERGVKPAVTKEFLKGHQPTHDLPERVQKAEGGSVQRPPFRW